MIPDRNTPWPHRVGLEVVAGHVLCVVRTAVNIQRKLDILDFFILSSLVDRLHVVDIRRYERNEAKPVGDKLVIQDRRVGLDFNLQHPGRRTDVRVTREQKHRGAPARPNAPRVDHKGTKARTSSMATEGTSAIITRRSAFAMDTSVPSSRNSQ